MQANTIKRNLVALAIVGSFAAGVVVADKIGLVPATAAISPPAVATAPAGSGAVALPDFSDLVASQGPAVVHISTSGSREKVSAKMPRGMPDLEDMFPGFRG